MRTIPACFSRSSSGQISPRKWKPSNPTTSIWIGPNRMKGSISTQRCAASSRRSECRTSWPVSIDVVESSQAPLRLGVGGAPRVVILRPDAPRRLADRRGEPAPPPRGLSRFLPQASFLFRRLLFPLFFSPLVLFWVFPFRVFFPFCVFFFFFFRFSLFLLGHRPGGLPPLYEAGVTPSRRRRTRHRDDEARDRPALAGCGERSTRASGCRADRRRRGGPARRDGRRLSLAFLHLLEASPVERAVFLLREVFDYPHDRGRPHRRPSCQQPRDRARPSSHREGRALRGLARGAGGGRAPLVAGVGGGPHGRADRAARTRRDGVRRRRRQGAGDARVRSSARSGWRRRSSVGAGRRASAVSRTARRPSTASRDSSSPGRMAARWVASLEIADGVVVAIRSVLNPDSSCTFEPAGAAPSVCGRPGGALPWIRMSPPARNRLFLRFFVARVPRCWRSVLRHAG